MNSIHRIKQVVHLPLKIGMGVSRRRHKGTHKLLEQIPTVRGHDTGSVLYFDQDPSERTSHGDRAHFHDKVTQEILGSL